MNNMISNFGGSINQSPSFFSTTGQVPSGSAAMDAAKQQKIRQLLERLRGKVDLSGIGLKEGGAAGFPDLTGDGKVTQADILKGRGVALAGGGLASIPMENIPINYGSGGILSSL